MLWRSLEGHLIEDDLPPRRRWERSATHSRRLASLVVCENKLARIVTPPHRVNVVLTTTVTQTAGAKTDFIFFLEY